MTFLAKAISQSGGIFAHIFITLNVSDMQTRASRTSENDVDFCIC